MNVAAILKMKGNDIVTVQKDVSLLDAAKLLSERDIGCVVVCNDDGSIAGIVSERDIVRNIAQGGPDVLNMRVSECMTTTVISCLESDTIEHVMGEMTEGRFRHLPVMRDNRMIGLVSIGDVVKMRIAEAELEAAAMREYITTG
jgi:CBS domain-containing protein